MKKYRFSFLFKPISFIANVATMNFAFLASYFIRFGAIETVFQAPYLILFWFFNISWLGLLFLLSPFRDSRISFNLSTLITNYSKITLIHIAVVMIFWVSLKGFYFSRQQLFFTYIISLSVGYIWRYFGLLLIRTYRTKGGNIRSYAIIGSGEYTKSINSYFTNNPELGFKFVGQYSTSKKDIDKLKNEIENESIDVLYSSIPTNKKDILEELIEFSKIYRLKIKIAPNLTSSLNKRIEIEYHGYIPIINISNNPFTDPKVELVKRIFDIILSISILIGVLPLFCIIMIITKLSSKGPIFYRQSIKCRCGNYFEIIKFRSMLINSDKIAEDMLNGLLHSIGEKDPRITKWGHFMRKTRLDELPQFWNVLKGDMSIVGPRPLAIYDAKLLIEKMPYEYKRLLTLRPGLTSLGQVTFGYASNEEELIKRLKCDLQYLNNYSIESDLKIIAKTLYVMLSSSGK